MALKPKMNLPDGKHPNLIGVKEIANRIYPIIKKEIFEK